MKFFAEAKRTPGTVELIAILLGLAYVASFVAATISGNHPPQLYEPLLGLFPFLALSATAACFTLTVFGRERMRNAVAVAISLASLACGIAIVASLVRLWNDGSYYAVLSPSDALISIATFGLYPFHLGPDVLVRFLPAVFGAGIAFRLVRSRAALRRTVLCAAGTYLALAFCLHAMSWIAGALSLVNASPIVNATDVYRQLVSAQADGYWTRGTSERFLSPIGRQADTGLMATHAAIVFLVSMAGLLVLMFRSSSAAARALVKRLVSRTVILFGLECLLGAALVFGAQTPRASYTDLIAGFLFVCAVILWCAWWRFGRDAENVARDEVEHPDFPLPAGTVAPHDLEIASRIFLALCLFGAWLLGWPVFIGFLSASLIAWGMSRNGFGWRDGIATEALGMAAIALCLAWTGAALGLRDGMPADWLFRLLVSSAVLFGLAKLSKLLRVHTESRQLLAGALSVGMAVAMLIARQKALWLPFVPAAASLIALSYRPGKWHRYGSVPIEALIGAIAFIALFVPKLIVHL